MITLNEMRQRALAFSREWDDARSEEAEAQTFLKEFFRILDINDRKVTLFEHRVHKLNDADGYIDMLWKGKILVEMKSRGEDLEKAYNQAKEYAISLDDVAMPKFILICDFYRFHLYDLDERKKYEFTLNKLHEYIVLFRPLIINQKILFREQDPANIEAAERMGKLHDKLKEIGYDGHKLEVYLVRLLFCLFADDTGIFNTQDFINYIEYNTDKNGSDLAGKISELFQVLDTPTDRRLTNLREELAAFPYVNGKLFEKQLHLPAFDSEMRQTLLYCCNLDWSKISPAIFGAMFQSIMNPEERRNLGAHYTSETNILKVINPLFMDELNAEFNAAYNNRNNLHALHDKIAKMRFLDPACGCGNFLITTYKELRILEHKIVKRLYTTQDGDHIHVQLPTSLHEILRVSVDQFYGIEHEEFPARIAEVALWLIDHQMNIIAGETFGEAVVRLPLTKHGNILNADALSTDWEEFFPKTEYNYILGNPPFVGARLMNQVQKNGLLQVFNNMDGASNLDFVTAWYEKAAQYIQGTNIEVAFVSTNSICQGMQASILWGHLMKTHSININFAHRSFKWSNEARGNAAVYCIIVGFAIKDRKLKYIYDYEANNIEPIVIEAKKINQSLFDAESVLITKRNNQISGHSKMVFGSMPNDNGHYLFTDEEKEEFLSLEPEADKFFKPLISATQFVNGQTRWCLWLKDAEPNELSVLPRVMERVEAVRNYRLNSTRENTIALSNYPKSFGEDRHSNNISKNTKLVVPRVSTTRREYLTFGFVRKDSVVGDTCVFIPDASLYEFGILSSKMHMTWNMNVAGRLGDAPRYAPSIVYNNFVFPEANDKQKEKIEKLAQDVLDARANHPKSTLADLYDPLTMPEDLRKAHNALDKAVDKLYGIKGDSDSSRMMKLLALYKERTAPLEAANQP